MMSAYGDWVRAARLDLGLTRERLRRRILLRFESAPTLSGIRDLEHGVAKMPTPSNRAKYEYALRASAVKLTIDILRQ